jgi:hypothetical protein
LPRHARRRGNMCLPRHPLRRGSPGNLGGTDGDLHPALPRHTAWRGRRLTSTKPSTLPRPRFKFGLWRGNTSLPRHARRRDKAAPPRHAVWRGRARLPTSPVHLRVPGSAAPHRMARRVCFAAPSRMARQCRAPGQT